MRKVALDIGDVRIGIAVSDFMNIIANPRETYVRKGEEQDLDYFIKVAKENEADTFVIGLPINMDGTEGPRVEICRAFGEKLREKSGLKVEYQDERLTTVEATYYLLEADMSRKKRKKNIDKIAANIILQTYLDKRKD